MIPVLCGASPHLVVITTCTKVGYPLNRNWITFRLFGGFQGSVRKNASLHLSGDVIVSPTQLLTSM